MVRENWFKRLFAGRPGRVGFNRDAATQGRLSGRILRTVSRSIEVCEARDLLSVAAIAVGSEARVNSHTTGDQLSSSIAVDSRGDYVVAWQNMNAQDGFDWGVYAQRFSYAGVPQGSEFLVNSVTTGTQAAPRVAMDNAGEFVVTWVSFGEDGSGAGIYARRYDSSGIAQGAEFLVNNYVTGDQTNARIAMDATGDFVIVWESHGQFPNSYDNHIGSSDIMAKRFNSAGVAQGPEFKVNSATTSTETDPGVGMDASGDFVVSWIERDFDNFVDPFPHVMAKQINSAGVVTQGDFEVASGYHGQQDSDVAMDPNGDYVVTWWGYQDDVLDGVSDIGIRGTLYNGTGAHQLTINSYQTGSQQAARVSFGANGDFVIAWQSQGPAQDGSGSGVYVQQYNADGSFLGAETRVNTYTTSGQSNPSVAMNAQGEFVVTWTSTGQDGSGQGVYSQQFLNTQTPLLLQIEGTPLSLVASQFTPITSQLNVRSAQAPNWTSATIAITSGYQNGQDVLSFANTANISGSWNAATGILTLTGTDSVSNYRSALRSVTFHNTDATPNTPVTRTISFQANASGTLSNVIARNVIVRATGIAPTVTGLSTVSYVNPMAPILVARNVVITDPDNLNILSATVSFTNWQGEDRVAFLNTLALQHTFTQDLIAHTATLTITGSATAAGYQALLRSVTYQDVAGNPDTIDTRVMTIQVSDQLLTATAWTGIDVSRYLTNLDASAFFYKGAPPQYFAQYLIVARLPGVSIQQATVSFTNWQGEDRVAFYNSVGLQHSFVQDLTAHTATLTISGAASAANYQTLLESVTYQDVAGNPILTTRVATITVNDGTTVACASQNIVVFPSQRPIVDMSVQGYPYGYVVNSPPGAFAAYALASDPDSNNLSFMTIQFTSGYQPGKDNLSFANQLGITGSFNATSGTMTLSGSSYVGNYRTALRSVLYNTTGTGVTSGLRLITIIAVDTSGVTSIPVTTAISVMP